MAFALLLDLTRAISWLRRETLPPSNVVQDVLPKATLLQTRVKSRKCKPKRPQQLLLFKGTVVLNAQCVTEHSGTLALLVYESELKGTLFEGSCFSHLYPN